MIIRFFITLIGFILSFGSIFSQDFYYFYRDFKVSLEVIPNKKYIQYHSDMDMETKEGIYASDTNWYNCVIWEEVK